MVLKSLLNLLQYCFCFMFWFFGREVQCNFSSLTRGSALTLYVRGRSLNHRTAREVPGASFVVPNKAVSTRPEFTLKK